MAFFAGWQRKITPAVKCVPSRRHRPHFRVKSHCLLGSKVTFRNTWAVHRCTTREMAELLLGKDVQGLLLGCKGTRKKPSGSFSGLGRSHKTSDVSRETFRSRTCTHTHRTESPCHKGSNEERLQATYTDTEKSKPTIMNQTRDLYICIHTLPFLVQCMPFILGGKDVVAMARTGEPADTVEPLSRTTSLK